MTRTVTLNNKNYTVVATPTQDSRNNWTCPTYTINGQTYNAPLDTAQAVSTFQSCAQAEEYAVRRAMDVIATTLQ